MLHSKISTMSHRLWVTLLSMTVIQQTYSFTLCNSCFSRGKCVGNMWSSERLNTTRVQLISVVVTICLVWRRRFRVWRRRTETEHRAVFTGTQWERCRGNTCSVMEGRLWISPVNPRCHKGGWRTFDVSEPHTLGEKFKLHVVMCVWKTKLCEQGSICGAPPTLSHHQYYLAWWLILDYFYFTISN